MHTSETICLCYFLERLLARRRPVMLVGTAGTGKSVLVGAKLASLDPEVYLVKNVPFNYYTPSAMLQGECQHIINQVNQLLLTAYKVTDPQETLQEEPGLQACTSDPSWGPDTLNFSSMPSASQGRQTERVPANLRPLDC